MIQLIKTKEAFSALKEEWNALLQTMEHPCIFLTWEWLYTWWEYYFSEESSCSLFILLVTDQEGKLTGIFPGFLRSARGMFGVHYTKLCFLGSEIEASDHLDVISSTEHRETVINEIVGYLRGAAGVADIAALTDIDEDSPSIDFFVRSARRSNYFVSEYVASTCPYIVLPSGYEGYLATLSARFRQRIRKLTRRILEGNEVRFGEVRNNNELKDMVNKLFVLHDKRWQGKKDKTVFYGEKKKAFHSRLAAVFFDSGFLRLFFLAVDTEVIACLYCFEYRDILFVYQSGFEPDWEAKAVGHVLNGKVIETCILEKKREFDFLRGAEAYKQNWTTGTRQAYNLTIGLTTKGKLITFCGKTTREMKAALKKFSFAYRVYKKLVKQQ